MSTTELMLKTTLEGRVLRTLQAHFRRPNIVLVKESLAANGLNPEQVEETLRLLQEETMTVAELMSHLREKGFFG
ncbi:hypothetical protein KDJ56_06725 [Brevibacillus composti]|uniref:Uncharacterized protein n=1 Tax=Brevibacillus composti TaxID=2796470 RepID=A0A7T5EN27_9BACL|nr:hypothetical protein [Brevibacillus composti]QQE75634.1 hypothetical protein JD108_07045 [Brevibacillus composti]QUO42660.1 hypothetical protein KDJ56_06725 [Brevibacillus composti]